VTELEAKDQRIAELEAENRELRKLIEELREQVRQLTARLNKNSLNSAMPPSRDGAETRKKRPRKPKSKRKRGGQKGHKRAERRLLAPEQVNEFVQVTADCCGGCGGSNLEVAATPSRVKQLIELPRPELDATQFDFHNVHCKDCGTTTTAPRQIEELKHGEFGPRLMALVCQLTGTYRLSKRKVQELLRDVYGLEIAVGTVSKLEARASELLAPCHDEVREHIRQSPYVHMDETSWIESHAGAWLWVACTMVVAYFAIAADRGNAVVKEILGENFEGISISDRAKAYGPIDADLRQVCWFHLDRNFKEKCALGGSAEVFGEKMRGYKRHLFKTRDKYRSGTIQHKTYLSRMDKLRRKVKKTLEEWSTYNVDGIAGMCNNLLEIEPALWNFVRNPGVEPTNNRAERDIRHAVIWRKISFGTDSQVGSRFVGRILTVAHTCKKQGRRTFEFLCKLFSAAVEGRPRPLLVLESAQ